MEHPGFFERQGPFSMAEVARHAGAQLGSPDDADVMLRNVRPLDAAENGDLTFVDNRKYLPALADTNASACLVAPAFADRLPAGVRPLLAPAPYHAFALALQKFYPDAMTPKAAGFSLTDQVGAPGIHPSAMIEEGAIIEPGAIVGRDAAVGRGTVVAAGALVGYRVAVGRDCYIGPGASITHALLGNGVLIHAGVRIGQDGFGFALGPKGHIKVPQIGRVIIQDKVEIGANTTIDRGSLKDTIIGEGTKIDNLVQIGHNVVLGRNCVIVAQVGISGSTVLGDFVIMGGHSGAVGHLNIGSGAQIAGSSHVKDNVPPGARMGGTPARPFKEWAREIAAIRRLARGDRSEGGKK
ncbi:MAG: UDP-3-O-(3-hydroxymyristoyl)glucosamine N-acyltransferase [Hyphomicrobiaceae bacterium]